MRSTNNETAVALPAPIFSGEPELGHLIYGFFVAIEIAYKKLKISDLYTENLNKIKNQRLDFEMVTNVKILKSGTVSVPKCRNFR